MIASYQCKAKIECLIGGCKKIENDIIPSVCIDCDESEVTLTLDWEKKNQVKLKGKKVKFDQEIKIKEEKNGN